MKIGTKDTNKVMSLVMEVLVFWGIFFMFKIYVN